MAELLISATDANGQQKGEVVDAKPLGHVWGAREGLPGYIQLTITDSTREKDAERAREWLTFYETTITSENVQRVRLRTNVHPQAISASGEGSIDVFDQIFDWAEEEYNAIEISTSITQMLYDLPKPITSAQRGVETFDEYLVALADIWNHQHDPRHDFLAETFVNQAVAQGGTASVNDAQADSMFVDKLTL